MYRLTPWTAATVVPLLWILGCTWDEGVKTVPSHTIPVEEIAAHFSARVDAVGNIQAIATLRKTWRPSSSVQNTPFLELTQGDLLMVSAGSNIQELVPVIEDGNRLQYMADLPPGTAGPGDEVRFVFERSKATYESVVIVPVSFDILSPVDGQSVPADAILIVECTPPGTWIYVSGSCVSSSVGYFVVLNNETVGQIFISASSGSSGESCPVELGVSREENGTLAAGFDGETSHIEAYQWRKVDITVTTD